MDERELRDLANDCVHCGFCLPACPTYSLWGEEMDSPRGRIHLVTQVLDGAELSPATAEHFDRCLGCMACMTACPSGVQYNRLIEAARAWTDDPGHAPPVQPGSDLHEVAGADGPDEAAGAGEVAETGRVSGPPVGGGRHRPWPDRVARAAIFAVFPYRERLRLLTGPLRGLQRTGLDRVVARTGLPSKLSPVLGAAMNLAPPPGPPGPRGSRPGASGGRWWACSPAACSRCSAATSTWPPPGCWPPRAATWSSPASRSAAARCRCTRAGAARALTSPGPSSRRSSRPGSRRSWSTRRAAARP